MFRIPNSLNMNFFIFYSNQILIIKTILLSLDSFFQVSVSQPARVLAAPVFLFITLSSSFGEWTKFMWLYQINLWRLLSLISCGLAYRDALSLVDNCPMRTVTLIRLCCIVSRQITHARLIVENAASSWQLAYIFPGRVFIQLSKTERVALIQKNVFHSCFLLFFIIIMIIILLIFSLMNGLQFRLDSFQSLSLATVGLKLPLLLSFLLLIKRIKLDNSRGCSLRKVVFAWHDVWSRYGVHIQIWLIINLNGIFTLQADWSWNVLLAIKPCTKFKDISHLLLSSTASTGEILWCFNLVDYIFEVGNFVDVSSWAIWNIFSKTFFFKFLNFTDGSSDEVGVINVWSGTKFIHFSVFLMLHSEFISTSLAIQIVAFNVNINLLINVVLFILEYFWSCVYYWVILISKGLSSLF